MTAAPFVFNSSGKQAAIDFGAFTLTWVGGTNSGTLTVSHHLGRGPGAVVVTPHDTGNPSIIPVCQVENVTAISFDVQATAQSAGSFTVGFTWIAIG